MKKLSMIALLLFGLSVSFNAQTSSQILSTTSVNVDANTSQNGSSSSFVESSNDVSIDSSTSSTSSKKKFKERTLVGKILIVAGLAIFTVICILFGTVSVG